MRSVEAIGKLSPEIRNGSAITLTVSQAKAGCTCFVLFHRRHILHIPMLNNVNVHELHVFIVMQSFLLFVTNLTRKLCCALPGP